jgi:predicted transcriptional regulator
MASNPTTSVKLDPDLKARLQKLAETRRRTPHWIMLEAIEQYVTREEKLEQHRQEAIDALEEYEATGLHVTGEEADAWLARLEAGEDAEPPIPHT